MKHLLSNVLIVVLAVVLFSCGQKKKAATAEKEHTHSECSHDHDHASGHDHHGHDHSDISKVYTISELLEVAEAKQGKKVRFKGTIQHVCAHSGKRAILIDETGKNSIRVEAKGKINGFNRELSGTDLVITGIVKMKPLKAETIDQLEAKTKAKQKVEEKGGEHCSAELANFKKMRDWMKKNNKNYYAIYYIDGLDYETK